MKHKHFKLSILAAIGFAAPAVQAGPLFSEQTHELAFGDFDADGRTDVLYIAKDPLQTSGVILSRQNSPLTDTNQSWPANYLGIPWSSGDYKPIIGDFNGDNRDDILLQRQTPGDHFVLLADATGQFAAISQTIPDNTGSQLWSAAAHRIVAGDFNGDGRTDLFLQSVRPAGLHALFLANSNGTFSNSQQTFSDGRFGFAWSKSNVYAGDFNGDHKDDLFVQRKPDIVIIDFEVPFPVPSYPAESFGLVQGKVLYQGEIFYEPILDSWSRRESGIDWSGANYRAVVADFNGDNRADIFLQGKNASYPNHLMTASTSGQLNSSDALIDPNLRAFSSQQGRIHAGNFNETPGFGIYMQAATTAGTNQFADPITSSSVVTSSHIPSPNDTPSAQTYQPFMTATRYNLGGQVTGTIAPDPDDSGPLKFAAVRNTYDSAGRLVRVEAGELSTWHNENVAPEDWGAAFSVFNTKEIAYDDYGRPVKKIGKGSDGVAFAAVQIKYDAVGHPLCKAVRMNPTGELPSDACQPSGVGTASPDRVTRTTYDTLNQLVKEERAVGTSLEQVYVENVYSYRMLQSQTDANGYKTTYNYDNYFRLKRRYFPHPDFKDYANVNDYNEYTYDENGNLKTDRKRSGAIITFTYDALNRPIKKDLSDNTYSPDVFMDYDLRGLMLHSRFTSDSGPGIKNTFDGLGRLKKTENTTSGVSRELNYDYDRNGNRTFVKHPDNNFFIYEFDGLNRLTEIKESGTTSLIGIEYYADGHRKKVNRMGGSGAATNYHYDITGRMDYFEQDFQGTSYDLKNTFEYSPSSQIASLTQNNSMYWYVGNQDRTGTYVPNGLNQIIKIGAQQISYDPNGNLSADGALVATYDLENRLVATAAPASSLKYDPMGRLAEYVANGTSTQFLYDGDALAIEYTVGPAAAIATRYIHGDRGDEPLVQYVGSTLGTRRFLHADHLGSIVAQSADTGSAVQTLSYDSFGIPAATNAGRFGFTGQIWLPEIGLSYYKARLYSPKLGRFLQTDPIGYKDGMNVYAYVGNDPISKIDPTGLKCEDAGSAIDCRVDNIRDKQGNLVPLTDAMRTEMKEAGKGFLGGLARFFGVGKAGLGAKIEKVENSMSVAMNAAKTAGTTPITIKGNGTTVSDTTVTGAQLVSAIVGKTDINLANFAKPGANGTVFADTSANRSTITWYSPGLGERTFGQEVTFLHETMHVGTNAWPLSAEPNQSLHRGPLNDAARDILEIGQ